MKALRIVYTTENRKRKKRFIIADIGFTILIRNARLLDGRQYQSPSSGYAFKFLFTVLMLLLPRQIFIEQE